MGRREKTEEEVDDIWTHLNRGSDGLRGYGQKDRVASLMLALYVRASRAEVVDIKTRSRSLLPSFLRDQDADSH